MHDHSSDESKKDLSNADVAETQGDDGKDEKRDNNGTYTLEMTIPTNEKMTMNPIFKTVPGVK